MSSEAEKTALEESNDNEKQDNEMMETEEGNEAEGDSSGDDSSSDEDEAEEDKANEEREAEINTLAKQISQNPYLYDNHTKRIQLLRDSGDLTRLREAREEMSTYFPLTEELWLDWLRDEMKLVTDETERTKVEELFEKAFQDYLSVPVWLEYVQFAIGRMAEEDGIQKVRDAFEKALTAVGLHVSQGSNIWEAYREFESAVLAGLMPQPGAVVSKEQEEAFASQNQRVISLFKRQLGVPLQNMELTLKEYKEWRGEEEVGQDTKTAYEKAKKILEDIQSFEDQLVVGEPNQLEVYQSYIQHEMKAGDPARIQCVFERAIKDNCLVPDFWIQYTKYMDKLNIKQQILKTYERALRNCPWSSQLWVNFLLALERKNTDFAKMKDTADKALRVGFNEASDYLAVWSAYCDYLRRRIDWERDHQEQLETFQLTIESAVDFMFENYGKDGDPEGRLRQFWAFIEAKHCKKMEKAREIWTQLMQEGHGAEAGMWLQYYQLERTFGDSKHCRKLLQKALNSVTDWPESITQAYLNFEREEGTLEQYDTALTKCEAQMERINERRAKAAEKEAVLQELKKKPDKKSQKKQHQHNTEVPTNSSQKEESNKKVSHVQDSARQGTGKRKHEQDSEGFLKPAVPAMKSDEPPQKKVKGTTAEEEHLILQREPVAHDPSKDNITVFVSNLDFNLEDERLREIFDKCGEINEIRLVRNYKGRSKGFGYVEFKDSNSVLQALKLDREFVDGRPMFVSRCEDRTAVKSAPQFKYATNLEKNKLFIKGLPFTITKDALETIFKEHGKVRDVRMVTYRNGRPKGIAYVEFDTEANAAQAVLKTDGLVIGEHTISVAISNPPERKTPFSSKTDPFARSPSLGSGKKETEFRGKARTQVSLVPRSVRQAPGQSGKPTVGANTQSATNNSGDTKSSENSSGGQSMSNADFRKMLLK